MKKPVRTIPGREPELLSKPLISKAVRVLAGLIPALVKATTEG